MVINCIFDADDNTLRAEDYYCISQDDNNSSVISVACRGIDAEDVSVAAKTGEGLDSVGKGLAVAAEAAATVI